MAVLSGGAYAGLSDANSSWKYQTNYQATTGLNLTRVFASYGAIYKAQLWVYVLVRKRALATRRLPLKVYHRTDETREEARDTPFAELLRTPNERHSGAFLWEWTSSTIDLYGEAIWFKIRGRDGLPAELWPIHPSNVSIEKKNDGSYWYLYGPGITGGADPEYSVPESDVVHFKAYNPDSMMRGMSALEPLRQSLVNEDAARRASSAFWNNGARPSGFLSMPGKLSQVASDRLEAKWSQLHGGVDNFGKWPVLEEGLEPKVLSLTAEDAQYIESRKLNREEVCAAYDVPPPVVHILDRATFSNITEQMRSMYRDTMAPHLQTLEATVNFSLGRDFDVDLSAKFLMDEVLRGDFEVRVGAVAQAVGTAQMTPNEGRLLENRPPIEGGDRLYINSALVPIDSLQAVPAVPPLPASMSDATVRAVVARTGRAATLDDIDVKTLTAGLNGEAATVEALYVDALVAGCTVKEFRDRVRAAYGEGS